jgi:hypothetical protein
VAIMGGIAQRAATRLIRTIGMLRRRRSPSRGSDSEASTPSIDTCVDTSFFPFEAFLVLVGLLVGVGVRVGEARGVCR